MQIFTLEEGDRLIISQNIIIYNLGIASYGRSQIKFGFEAPRSVTIMRTEILDRYPLKKPIIIYKKKRR